MVVVGLHGTFPQDQRATDLGIGLLGVQASVGYVHHFAWGYSAQQVFSFIQTGILLFWVKQFIGYGIEVYTR